MMFQEIAIPPTVDQLQQLADIGASSPTENAPRRLNGRTGGYFAVDKLDSIVVRGEDEGLKSVRHSMGVRMGRRAVGDSVDICRLEFFDAYRVEYPTQEQVKSVTKYEFEWSDETVLLARRLTSLKGEQDYRRVRDLGDEILRFHVRDDAAAILQADLAFEEMMKGDCRQLIEDTTAYYAQVSAVNRQSVV